jgi:hypothetical protein
MRAEGHAGLVHTAAASNLGQMLVKICVKDGIPLVSVVRRAEHVYIYGLLDGGPTELTRDFGMAWGIGGWLVMTFLQRIGQTAAQKLRERVAAEIKTTFASRYDREVSLAEALRLEEIAVYGKQATGQKYLINPNKGLGR